MRSMGTRALRSGIAAPVKICLKTQLHRFPFQSFLRLVREDASSCSVGELQESYHTAQPEACVAILIAASVFFVSFLKH